MIPKTLNKNLYKIIYFEVHSDEVVWASEMVLPVDRDKTIRILNAVSVMLVFW